MVRKGAPRAHGPQYPHSSCTPRPFCSRRLRGQSKARLRAADLTAETRGSNSPLRGAGGGWQPEGTQSWLLLHLPQALSTSGDSPSRQAQEVQEGETGPEGRRDRGYLLGRNHLCNMPYFKPVQVSRLSRCPEQGARRGQRLSAVVRTLALTLARAHTRLRSASPSRGGRVCARGPGRRFLPCLAPSFPCRALQCMESCVSPSHPFVPAPRTCWG